MLTRNRPKTLPLALTLVGQGETVKFNITYHNRRQSEVEENLANSKEENETLLFIVKEWEAEYPLTLEGIKEMEDDRPGTVLAVIHGFHKARRVEQEKN